MDFHWWNFQDKYMENFTGKEKINDERCDFHDETAESCLRNSKI